MYTGTLLRELTAPNPDAWQRVPLIGRISGDNRSTAVTGTLEKIPITYKGMHLVVMETCRSIITTDRAGSQVYETFHLGKVTEINIMMPNTVNNYVLETWEDLEKLREVLVKLTTENAIAMVFTISTVDRLDIIFRLDMIRSVAKLHKLTVPRGIIAIATNREISVLESQKS